MTLMSILRSLFVGLLASLFTVLLFLTALDVGIVTTVSQPATVKQLLHNSGIYTTVVPSILSQQSPIETPYGSLDPSSALVQKAASGALPATTVEQDSNTVIDSVYAWLNGRTSTPTFSIDLSGFNGTFASQIGAGLEQQLSTLPACGAHAQPAAFDPLTATCLPKGVTAASAANQVAASLTGNQGLLTQSTLSSHNLTNPSTGQPVFTTSRLRDAPRYFQLLKDTPYLLDGLTILVGLGIIVLSKTIARGLRRVGIPLLLIGALMLGVVWAISHIVERQLIPHISIANAVAFQQAAQSLATNIAQIVANNYRLFGMGYLTLGIILIAGSFLFRKRHQTPAVLHAAPEITAAPAADTPTPLPARAPATAPQPARHPVKIAVTTAPALPRAVPTRSAPANPKKSISVVQL